MPGCRSAPPDRRLPGRRLATCAPHGCSTRQRLTANAAAAPTERATGLASPLCRRSLSLAPGAAGAWAASAQRGRRTGRAAMARPPLVPLRGDGHRRRLGLRQRHLAVRPQLRAHVGAVASSPDRIAAVSAFSSVRRTWRLNGRAPNCSSNPSAARRAMSSGATSSTIPRSTCSRSAMRVTTRAAIRSICAGVSASNVTTSSIRFRNSGRKACLAASRIASPAEPGAPAVKPSPRRASPAPRFDVITTTVLVKSTVRPSPSVSRPSSISCSSTFQTSGGPSRSRRAGSPGRAGAARAP